MPRLTFITAFEETKNFKAWINDDRCVVGYSCLKQRIKNGWIPEKAITTKIFTPTTSIKDLKIGDTINRLTLEEKYVKNDIAVGRWRCKCGNIKKYRLYEVVSQNTKSCGCYKIDYQRQRMERLNRTHGHTSEGRVFKEWCGIIGRCHKPKNSGYPSYGGRGIRVCDEWRKDFIKFREWAISNGYSDSLSIDRLDTNYHYCPENCRWADNDGQYETKRNNRQILAFNEVKSLIHWTRDPRCKNDIETIKKHLAEGRSPEEAMSV